MEGRIGRQSKKIDNQRGGRSTQRLLRTNSQMWQSPLSVKHVRTQIHSLEVKSGYNM